MTDTCDIAAYAAWQRRITPMLKGNTTYEGWLRHAETRVLTREALDDIIAARGAMFVSGLASPEWDDWLASPDFAAAAVQQLIGCWAATPNNTKRFAAALADELVGRHREFVVAAILELRRTRKTLPSVACVHAAIEAEQVLCKGDDYIGEDENDTGWRPHPGAGTKAWRAFPSVSTVYMVLEWEGW